MAPLRWGILGTGKISHDFCVGVASGLSPDEHKLVAVAETWKLGVSAKDFAKLHNIPKSYETYEEIVKDPEIDIIYIGTVNPQHLSQVKLALDNGKHVLCEKPLGMNVKEVKEMLEYAKGKNLFFMEAIWARFFPSYQELRKRLNDGSLGDVLQVIVSFGVLISDVDRVKLKELGGGTILDIGIYCVQFALLVFGEKPEKIICGGHLNANGVDESTSTTLIFSGGRTATCITHSRVVLPTEAIVFGTKQTLKFRAPFNCSTEVEEVGTGKVMSFPLPEGNHKTFYTNSVGLHYQCHDVRKCILNGQTESSVVPHSLSLTIAEILECMRKQLGVVYPQDE